MTSRDHHFICTHRISCSSSLQSLGQMESPRGTRSAKAPPTCTVPGFLVGLTNLCKLTKVCAAPTLVEDKKAATKPKPGVGEDYGGYDKRLVLIRLFEAMATLKSAYIKLQKSHFPCYDPAKMAFADEIIASELDSAAALQVLCSSRCGIGELVNERWSLVQELEAETRKRDSDIVVLRRELEGLQRENSRLNMQVKSGDQKPSSSSSVNNKTLRFAVRKALKTTTAAPASAVVEQFKVASRSVSEFAELLHTRLMNLGAWSDQHCIVGDGDAAAENYRYALEAHLWRTMLGVGGGRDTEEEEEEFIRNSARFDRIMRFCDPLDALMQHPGSSFSRFCGTKYLAAVPSEAEFAVLKNRDHRALVWRGGHPRTWFYRAFAAMARSAWALRVMMIAARRSEHHGQDGVITIFYARRGTEYREECMESVVVDEVGREEKLGVAFTVAPGVKVGDTVVAPCRVLCSSSLPARHHQSGGGA